MKRLSEPDFYYNSRQNVLNYIKMAEPYNGKVLVDQVNKNLPAGSTILELGMGPGKDMMMLEENYLVTGSERSEIFLELYRNKHPDADLLLIDASSIEIDRTFDCIYSNKVLHHLKEEELHESLSQQIKILNTGGMVIHSFWEGNREEVLSGLTFRYYQPAQLDEVFSRYFHIQDIEVYSEIYPDDSIWIMGKVLDN